MGENNQPPAIWSTLSEYEGDPETLARKGAGEWNTKPKGFADRLENLSLPEFNLRRRDFLKLSGFAAVLAAAGCGERPAQTILPYVNAPEEIVPGVANYYASTCRGCEAGCGLIVKTREARPIKLEGNPEHPVNGGTLCSRGQVQVIGLYDPDRLRHPITVKTASPEAKDDPKADWAKSYDEIAKAVRRAGSKAVLLTGTIHGPARGALLDDFKKAFPGLRHVTYDALADDGRRKAAELCYGKAVVPRYHFDKSDVTVLLGADPMSESHSPVEHMAGIGASRRLRGKEGHRTMGRLYAFEPLMSMSGMNADYRFAVRPQHLATLALAIAAQLMSDGHSEISGVNFGEVKPASLEKSIGLPAGTIERVADDLWNARGRSLVYTGGAMASTEAGTDLHLAVNLLNSMLGNEGKTVDAARPSNQAQGSAGEMLALIEDMKAGKVDALLIEGTNPAYSLPENADFAGAMKRVALKVSFGSHKDETGVLCDTILPGVHFLEGWGDAEPFAGLYSIQQPAIRPLWDNRSFEDSLISLASRVDGERFKAGAPEAGTLTWYDYLKRHWETQVFAKGNYSGKFEEFWFAALRRGVLDTRPKDSTPGLKTKGGRYFDAKSAYRLLRHAEAKTALGYTLAVFTSANTYDGRHQNNPYLLELPDPVAKVSWDNFVAVAPRTAREKKLKDGDMLRLTANGVSVEAPVRIHPGAHPEVLYLGGGWGRTHAGAVGSGEGFNAFRLGAIENGVLAYSGSPVEFEKTGQQIKLADVQGHNSMEGRPIVQETNLDYLNRDSQAPQPPHHLTDWEPGQPLPDMWKAGHEYTKHKWVMSIDLNSCVGCNACVVACQVENNVPVVGKREVLVGREMHWIRIDRYFKGDPDAPEVAKQPMLCQHCDNAPCETVCPVLATVHSTEGLNQQIYNRCVGTRYCANNCPYKVRRFNFFEYSSFRNGPHRPDQKVPGTPLELALNPDITVRTKGIMEKCSFCAQRIRAAKEDAREKGRDIPAGELQTACQQTCPAQAITFGDALNPEHEVNRVREENRGKRGYGVLDEFNVQPNIMYLAGVRNREPRDFDVRQSAAPHGGGHEEEKGTEMHGGGEEQHSSIIDAVGGVES